MIGREYLWAGRRWRVVARWGAGGPRNVLIVDVATGETVVRPFRGLRRAPMFTTATGLRWHRSTVCAESRATGWRAVDDAAEHVDFYAPCGVCARIPHSPGNDERRLAAPSS